MGPKPYIIGIAGGSASGKTSFLRDLKELIAEEHLTIISQDNYYHPKEMQFIDENGEINFDLPTSIDREHFHQDLVRLKANKTVKKKEYTFNNQEAEPKLLQLNPAPIIIMEGLFIFH